MQWSVSVYDSKDGGVFNPSADASVYDSLYYGDEYTWNVSRHGYISRREKFTVGEETEIQVKLEQQTATQPEITDNDWSSYRNSETNNGITNTSHAGKQGYNGAEMVPASGCKGMGCSTYPLH